MSGANLLNNLLECIDRLKKCGFTVVNVTSDQGSNFTSVANQLGVSARKPFFVHAGTKIHVTPDPPHLIKSFRNLLLNNTVVSSDGKASWQFIEILWQLEKSNQHLRLAKKLTENHIKPPLFFGKMKVKLASQVLSNSVSGAMNTYVELGKLPKEALPTAKFCKRVNDIFDILNSNVPHQFYNSSIINAVSENVLWLDSLLAYDKKGCLANSKLKCIKGMKLEFVKTHWKIIFL